MIIQKAILHVADREQDQLICSQKEFSVKSPAIAEYLQKIVQKFEKSDTKVGEFATEHPFFTQVEATYEDFVGGTTQMAQAYFDVFRQTEDAPNGDLLFLAFTDEGKDAFALLKLNYKKQFTHFADYEDDQLVHTMIQNQAIFPAASSTIEEGFILDRHARTFRLKEKAYKIEGKRVNYWTTLFLQTETTPTLRENLREVKQVVKKLASKYQEDEHQMLATVQRELVEKSENAEEIEPYALAEALFPDNFAAKSEYLSVAEEREWKETIPIPNRDQFEKKYAKQKIKLSNGIEMTIPLELYHDRKYVEFVNQPDGTMTVILNNIEEVLNKF